MQASQGVFIAIEGTDGSGKSTQFERVARHLADQGYDVATFDFPQYDHPSSFFVREYLSGSYGTAEQVGPYTGSLFYALDRFQAGSAIRAALAEGKIVLANRFVGSNMAHQGTKFHHAEERRGYFIWLDNLEFEMLRTPRPTMSFVLRVPATISQKLISKRGKEQDIHERDLQHLEKSVEVYDDMCRLFPKDFIRIDCTDNDQLLSIEDVSTRLWTQLEPILPVRRSKKPGTIQPGAVHRSAAAAQDATQAPTQPSIQPVAHAVAPATTGAKPAVTAAQPAYVTPETLPADVRKVYAARMDELYTVHDKMLQRLIRHLTEASGLTAQQRTKAVRTAIRATAERTLRGVLPVAANDTASLVSGAPVADSIITQVVRERLSDTYTEARESVVLTDVWPRNELEIIGDMVYQYADLPLQQVRSSVAEWKYQQKIDVFEAYLHETDPQALHKIRYSWDIVSDFGVCADFVKEELIFDMTLQQLTPRYGYEMPQLIEEAGLTDMFESCFESSLELHSFLQSKGYIHEAQLATLLGHHARWKGTTTAAAHLRISRNTESAVRYSTTISHMSETLATIHPVLCDAMNVSDLTTK